MQFKNFQIISKDAVSKNFEEGIRDLTKIGYCTSYF